MNNGESLPCRTKSISHSREEKLTSGFVLESVLAGTSNMKLIYGNDVPTLAYLVQKLRAKHCLNPEQEIVTVSVKIGDMVYYNVGLDERRDWKYILGVVERSGARAEVFVSTS